MNWTAPLEEFVFRKFKVKYSNRGALRLLKELGFSCTRLTYTLANADPIKKYLKKLKNIKLRLFNGDIDRIF